MPREDLSKSVEFLSAVTAGLDGAAPLQKHAAIDLPEELPEGLVKLSSKRYIVASDKLGEYPWDQGGVWRQVASPDGRQLLVREDRIPELQAAGMIQTALNAEPPEYVVPPEVARDKVNRLDDKAEDRDLSQQETELRTRLHESLDYKGLEE